MMRIRTIKPEWLEDERMAEASSDARVLSIALILLADDAGRGRLNRATAARCFPSDPATFDRAFAELSGWFVERYEVRGQGYYAIVNWSKHQRIDKPSKPRTPEPEEITQNSSDSETVDTKSAPQEITPNGDTREPSRDTRETLANPTGPFPDGPGPGPGKGRDADHRAPARVASDVPRQRAGSSIDCPDPLGEYDTVSSLELPWRAWLAESRKRGMSPTEADRRAEARHLEGFEARILEQSAVMAEARGWTQAEAAAALMRTAAKRYGELYDASRAEGFRGKPLAWRLGFVVARWAELTKDAIPARAT